MTTEMIINKTIEELREVMQDASARLNKYDDDLRDVNEMLEIINNLDVNIISYNPSKVFDLLKENNLQILGINDVFTDVQNIVEYCVLNNNREVNLDEFEDYKLKINELKNNLYLLKEFIEKKLLETKQKLSNDGDIENLKRVVNVIKGEEKYITEDMLKTLHRTVLVKHSYEELKQLYEDLYNSENFKIEENYKKAIPELGEVISLFNEYISWTNLEKYINDKKDYILSKIDLENAKSILEFLQSKNMLNRFSKVSIIKIATEGKYDSIVKTYETIIKKVPESIGINPYLVDNAISVWISSYQDESKRKNGDIRILGKRSTKNEELIYPQYNIENILRNVQIIKENADLFDEMSEEAIFNSSLVKFTYPHILERNIKICRMFGIGKANKIKLSMLKLDLENKINYAIELGLLKSPMSKEFKEYEYIAFNQENNYPSDRRLMYDSELRNYFSNYTSKLMSFTNAQYAYYTNKLSNLGYTAFYREFFNSEHIPGRHIEEDRSVYATAADIPFIKPVNVIDNYYEYADEIDNNYEIEFDNQYFNPEILNDPLISNLESNNIIFDEILVDGQNKEVKNEYAYKFDNRLISRYKVLRSASILKSKYGTLTKDMLLTSILKGSFILEDDLNSIKKSIEYGRVM